MTPIFIIEVIIGFGISGWMILTGNYPFNLELLLSGFRTRKPAFEPSGNWVKISGGIFFLGTLLVLLSKIGVFPGSEGLGIIVISTVFVLGVVSIVVSFIVSLS